MIIYGAGDAGIHMSKHFINSKKYDFFGFIDDDISKVGTIINSKTVLSSSNIKHIIQTHDIKLILLAIPSLVKVKDKKYCKRYLNYQSM